MPGSININQLTTENDLEHSLSLLGLKTRQYKSLNVNVIRRSHEKFIDEPCRWIAAEDNNFELDSLVIIEGGKLCVYYYDFPDDLFRFFWEFEGTVDLSALQETIVSITTIENLKKKLGF